MLVRSRNGKILLETDYLFIRGDENSGYVIIGVAKRGDEVELGHYVHEEDAIKALNELGIKGVENQNVKNVLQGGYLCLMN